MGIEAGIDNRIYYIDGPFALTAASWLKVANLKEPGLSRDEEEAESKNRDSMEVKSRRTFRKTGITFTVEVNREDQSYLDLMDAADAQTIIPIGVGISNAVGAKLRAFDAVLFLGPETQADDSATLQEFTARPAMGGANNPQKITLTA